MKLAFTGWNKILVASAAIANNNEQNNNNKQDSIIDGWKDIVKAAKNANKVFHTMTINTPPSSYPLIRLPIKGVRHACGTVYHPHGVFYEGIGLDEYYDGQKNLLKGIYIDNEWGQTGANSSMYKWFDIFCGVAQTRNAYNLDSVGRMKMSAVFNGTMDSGELGDNPIDSMQRSFDLFTRPSLHMKILVDTEKQFRNITSSSMLLDNPQVLL